MPDEKSSHIQGDVGGCPLTADQISYSEKRQSGSPAIPLQKNISEFSIAELQKHSYTFLVIVLDYFDGAKSSAKYVIYNIVRRHIPFTFTPFIISVSEHLGRVCNVVLIKCIFGSGKPRGVGISGKGPHGLNEGTEDQFMSNQETRWTDPVTARRVPSKRSRGTRGTRGARGARGTRGARE
jgi:hypothetical protein